MQGAKSRFLISKSAPWIGLLLLVLTTGEAAAFSGSDVMLSATRVGQGDSVFLKIRARGRVEPRVQWMGTPVFLVAEGKGETWYGFLGVDLKTRPGPAPLDVEGLPGGEKRRIEIAILEKDRGVRVLTLPREMVELDPQTLDRVRKESGIMNEVLGTSPSTPSWTGPFVPPLSGRVVGVFGTRSVINGLNRSPHSGVDLKAEAGTPVHSINNGRVLLTAEHFFTGKTVVIDHGGAIQSMYFHLEKFLVDQGEEVRKGQTIGLVGSTGRATGPHLHFGVRINGARVDPMQFMALSKEMGQP